MTEIHTAWLVPLILLPGVSLLISSTAARYHNLHDELHRTVDTHSEALRRRADFLLHQAMEFRNALVSLYCAVALFSLGSLAGLMTIKWETVSLLSTTVLTSLGVLLLLYASFQLIRQSIVSNRIIEAHVHTVKGYSGRDGGR